MHKDVLTRNAACNCDRDLAFASAIDQEIMGLGPFGEGFAQEGFPGIRDARGRGIICLQGRPILHHGSTECGSVIDV